MVLLFAYTKKVSKRKIKDFAKLSDDKELFLHIQHHLAFSFFPLEVIGNIFFRYNYDSFYLSIKKFRGYRSTQEADLDYRGPRKVDYIESAK